MGAHAIFPASSATSPPIFFLPKDCSVLPRLMLAACPKCRAAFLGRGADPAADLRTHRIVPIKRDMTQVRLFGGRCAWCGERVTAEAPAGLEQGSPFGHSTVAIVVYLHHAHAIGVVDWRR